MPPRSISNKKKYRLGVIGTINRDSVTLPDGTIRHGWGGILFNLKGLSEAIGREAGIYPACRVGADCFGTIQRILKSVPGVGLDYVHKVFFSNNHCHLTYHSEEDKTEILEGGVGWLAFEDIRGLLDCDIVLMNFISGSDIHINSLEKFCRLYRGKIYIDIHSFTLGKRANGQRYLRCPPGWEKVVACGDYFQMNKLELAVLLKLNPSLIKSEKIEYYLGRLLSLLERKKISPRDRKFIVTDGSRGCVVAYFRSGNPYYLTVRPPHLAKGRDTTGCGDSFAAGFVAGITQGKALKACAVMGHEAAGRCLAGKKFYNY